MRNKQINIRVNDKEKQKLNNDAIKNGFRGAGSFLMWLWYNWKKGL